MVLERQLILVDLLDLLYTEGRSCSEYASLILLVPENQLVDGLVVCHLQTPNVNHLHVV